MSSKSLAVEVNGLSKRYLISHQEKHKYLGDALLAKMKKPFAKPAKDEFWALRDVSFEVEQGDVLGVIGRNGAGKSTMLKILSQIAEPTEGEIRMHGRVGSLLEVGTGFHPELTGRENIFLNGTILGMRKREVERKFDEIVEFAEVSRFIDTPVKRYSSGMYVRLAFAVAANLTPEILIVDEVLAVGDAQFQAKCLGKMQDIAQGEGRTVLFVSHNMGAVKALCNKAALLRNGQLSFFGDVDRAIELYAENSSASSRIIERARILCPGITLDEITVNGSDATELAMGHGERTLDIKIRGKANTRLRARLNAVLYGGQHGTYFGHFAEELDTGESPVVEPGTFLWNARIELPVNMNEGLYGMTLNIDHYGVQTWIEIGSAFLIQYAGTTTARGETFKFQDYGFVILDGEVQRTPSLAQSSPS